MHTGRGWSSEPARLWSLTSEEPPGGWLRVSRLLPGLPSWPWEGLLPRRKGQSCPRRWGLGLDWLRRSFCLALAAFVGRPLPAWAGSHRVPLQTPPRRGGWGSVGVSPAVAPVPGRPGGGWFPRLAEPPAPAGSLSEARAPCWAGRAVLRPPPRGPHTGPTPSKYQAWRWGVGGAETRSSGQG